ncbi:MAG: hypothetical protein M1389_05225, partial [Chloroflexi bacterium]|nr:hypothetical protein [Chloroflexota bacterium]
MGLVEDHPVASSPDDSALAEAFEPPAPSGAASRNLWQRALSLDQHTVIVTLGFLCLFGVNFMVPTDPDFWWHLRTGQLIAQTGALPAHDIFSYTAFGQPWMIPEWLAELVTYWLYAAGGYATVVAVFSLVATGAYFVLYRLLLRLGVDRTLALALVVWTVVVRWAQWAPRPQLITFLFFSVALYLLFTFKERGRARLWVLPPLTVVWVNVHGGYVIGILLIGLFVAGEILNHLTHRPAARIRPLIFTGLASVVAALANPSGYAALIYPFKYATTGNASMRYISEWQSVDFHSYVFLPFALAIVLLMIVG